jgi:hypothetical protein
MGFSEILNQQGGSSFDISETTNQQYSVTSQKTWFWTSVLCQPQISHKIYFQLFFFNFCTCEWAKKFHPRLVKLTVSFGSLSHIFIWDLVELYLTILNVQRTFISYLLAPLTIVSMLFNSLTVWLLLLFISPWRTMEFHFVLFLPQMNYVLLWNERWSTFVFWKFTSVSKLLSLRHLNFAVTALFRDCSEDICWQTYPSRCHFSGFIKFCMLSGF